MCHKKYGSIVKLNTQINKSVKHLFKDIGSTITYFCYKNEFWVNIVLKLLLVLHLVAYQELYVTPELKLSSNEKFEN